VEVIVDGGSATGLRVVWFLDEEFSQLILSDCDTSGKGTIEPADVPRVKAAYFDNLRLFDYFCHIYQGKDALPTPVPQEFQADLQASGKMRYRFFLPLNLKLKEKDPLSLSFYDDSFYVDVEFVKKDPVILTINNGGKASVTLRPDKTKSYYGGGVTPTFATITWRLP
jgi:ABC-type uncharacterized transport system substrate-binding protein